MLLTKNRLMLPMTQIQSVMNVIFLWNKVTVVVVVANDDTCLASLARLKLTYGLSLDFFISKTF
jgi:hypothetical protein